LGRRKRPELVFVLVFVEIGRPDIISKASVERIIYRAV
jgi:hypothetical protein